MSAQSDPQFLERDEFYLALRLIALSQNNLEVSDEVIRINHPIPPLPKIDLKLGSTNSQNLPLDNSIPMNNSKSSNTNFSSGSQIPLPEKDLFTISEEDENRYTFLFTKNKDLPEKMSLKKLNEILISGKISSNILTKIFNIVKLSNQNEINLSEFKVVFKLIYKSKEINDVPAVLPNSLKFVLEHGEARQKAKEVDFMQSTNMRNSSQNDQQVQQNQNQQGMKYLTLYFIFLFFTYFFSQYNSKSKPKL